ncbi:MAG TPA: hypothetical protein DCZ04_00160 [Syntrophorhabdus aromaticivorans]|mgnify:FL=1|jgi:hypothetical protein|nr:hypothetical protein [Syntrophorhabdus aromaticivorans]
METPLRKAMLLGGHVVDNIRSCFGCELFKSSSPDCPHTDNDALRAIKKIREHYAGVCLPYNILDEADRICAGCDAFRPR